MTPGPNRNVPSLHHNVGVRLVGRGFAVHAANGMESEQTFIRHEDGLDCDGVVCETRVIDDDGNPVSWLGLHGHVVVSGINPLLSARYYSREAA